MSSYECMLLDIKNHVATVTVNRPGVMNALNWQAYAELEQIFRDLQNDPEVRCIILTGSGRAFCSGEGADMAGGAAELTEVLFALSDPGPEACILGEGSWRWSKVAREKNEVDKILVGDLRITDRIGVNSDGKIRQVRGYGNAHLVDQCICGEVLQAGDTCFVSESADPAIDHCGPA